MTYYVLMIPFLRIFTILIIFYLTFYYAAALGGKRRNVVRDARGMRWEEQK